MHRQLQTLDAAKVSVVAADAVAAGRGRYRMILWVMAEHYARPALARAATHMSSGRLAGTDFSRAARALRRAVAPAAGPRRARRRAGGPALR